jgi:hypothetical protein
MSPHLIYYKKERDELNDTKYDQKISKLEAIGLVHYLSNHFKVPIPKILIKGKRYNKFRYPDTLIFLTTYIVSGDVSHEFAHYLQFLKTGESRHDNSMLVYTKKIQKYVDTLI